MASEEMMETNHVSKWGEDLKNDEVVGQDPSQTSSTLKLMISDPHHVWGTEHLGKNVLHHLGSFPSQVGKYFGLSQLLFSLTFWNVVCQIQPSKRH